MKGLLLYSGGLDSLIVLHMMLEQNIDLELVRFNHSYYSYKKDKKDFLKNINIKITDIDITFQFNNILNNVEFNYGKTGINPCLDCHKNFLLNAWKYGINKYGKDNFFIITGDVLGQRGNSQLYHQIKKLEETIPNIKDYILRPLSAKLLPITIPEKLGIIDRNKLEKIQGRNRSKQFELLKKYNISNYETPSGGCLLTEKYFADRYKNFKKIKKYDITDLKLIKIGRHFTINNKILIISRNETENNILKNYINKKFYKISQINNLIGPIAFIDKNVNDDELKLFLEIILSYYKTDKKEYIFIFNNKKIILTVKSKSDFKKYLI